MTRGDNGELTRLEFLKTTGAAAALAGVTLSGLSVRAEDMPEKIERSSSER